MMKVKTVGYFKEMPHGETSADSIYDFINKEDKLRIDKICRYLENGIEFIVSPGMVEDIINPEKGTAGVTSTYTDGMWFWPGDLSYYVRNYGLKLPDEFIETMEENGWEIKVALDDLDYEEIEVDGIKYSEEN